MPFPVARNGEVECNNRRGDMSDDFYDVMLSKGKKPPLSWACEGIEDSMVAGTKAAN